MKTAEQLNPWDNMPNRKIWFQFWDCQSHTNAPIWLGSITSIKIQFGTVLSPSQKITNSVPPRGSHGMRRWLL